MTANFFAQEPAKRNIVAGVLLLMVLILSSESASAQSSTWNTRAPMPTARSGAAAVQDGGFVYVLGGEDNSGNVTDVVERYNPTTNEWQVMPERLRRPRKNAAAVMWRNTIYVMGGRDNDGEVSSTVEYFDLDDQRWRQFDDLVIEREGAQAIVVHDELYLVGGSDQNYQILNSIEFYDQIESKWKIDQDWVLESARAGFALGVVEDSVFAIGGFNTFGPVMTLERYVPGIGNATRKSFAQARGNIAAGAVSDSIYAVGGRTSSSQVVGATNIFVASQNAWTPGPTLITPRERFAIVVVGRKLFAFGGKDAFGNVLSSVELLDLSFDVATQEEETPPDPFFGISNAFPNPFSGNVLVEYDRPVDTTRIFRIDVFDLMGRRVRSLRNNDDRYGRLVVQWDGTNDTGQPVSAGTYFVRMTNGRLVSTRQLVLIR